MLSKDGTIPGMRSSGGTREEVLRKEGQAVTSDLKQTLWSTVMGQPPTPGAFSLCIDSPLSLRGWCCLLFMS